MPLQERLLPTCGTMRLSDPPKLAKAMRMEIAADHDPLVCSRVLALFAQRNLIPTCFSAWKENDEVLRIVLRVADPNGLDWRHLQHRVETIPSAIWVVAEPSEP